MRKHLQTPSKSQGFVAPSDRWQRGYSLPLWAYSSSLILEIKHKSDRLSQTGSISWKQGQKQARTETCVRGIVVWKWYLDQATSPLCVIALAACQEHACCLKQCHEPAALHSWSLLAQLDWGEKLQRKTSHSLASPSSCQSSQAKTWSLQTCRSAVGFPSLDQLAFCSKLSF